MNDLEILKELYLALGVGGVSFIVLIGIIIYLVRNIYPMLTSVMNMMEVLKEVISNNTKAIDEMAKSNHNVSTALNLLERSMTSVEDKVEQVQETTEDMEKKLIIINEHLKK